MNNTHYTGDDVLNVMARHAQNRNRSIEKLIIQNLNLVNPDIPLTVLEFGAGKGEFILRFLKRGNIEVLAVESDPTYRELLSKSMKVFNSIDDVPAQLDCIYLIDVLEHLEEDQQYLMKFFEKLKKGGRLFIYVPARMELYSSFDKKIGHYRRYEMKELKNKIIQVGFSIEVICYHDMLGYAASWLNKTINKSPDLNPKAVRLYDRLLIPITNFVESFINVPIGKSIYLTAVRK